tara:strand:+ start:4689 stop:5150 length:462 start_codon:yes stop_codon:yes gene_type:complete
MEKKMKPHFTNLIDYLHNSVQSLNDSKIFAGLMIITLNVASKFVNIKLSKSMQSFLKNTFSKYLLVFTIAWIGTRDIYIALIVTVSFILIIDFLLDDDSAFYILPNDFKEHYINLFDDEEEKAEITEEDIKKAQKVLTKAKKQNGEDFESYKI